PLTLQQAVEMALSNNPDLAVARVEPQLGAALVDQALGAFTPYLTGSAGHTSTLSTPTSFLVTNGTQTTNWFATAGVRQRLPFYGGTWNVSWDQTRQRSNSILTNFSPQDTPGLLVSFS